MYKTRKSSNEAKQDILHAAEKLFKIHGYDKTTLQMIANELDIAQGTLGHHFSNKYKITHELFFNYIRELHGHVLKNMPADCNRYQYHMTVSVCFWRDILKKNATRELFFHKHLVSIWEKDNINMAELKYREITRDFRKDFTEEEIHMASLIEEGAQPRLYKEFIDADSAITINQFCYYQCHMTGLLANLDEATIKRNIARIFEIADSIPVFEGFSIE